jgi:hypothetical protein
MINIKLGIIYYSDNLTAHKKLDYIEYIKINDINDIKLINKPTLIVGWSLIKEKFKNTNILNKKINSIYYWTFSFNEKNNDHVFDIDKFCTIDVLNIFKFYNYIILSPVFNTDLNKIENYIEYFNDCEINNIFLSKNMELSILCNNNIYKINLKELNYYKINPKILLDYLKNKYNSFTYDKSGKIENNYIEYFNNLDSNIVKKYIPLFGNVKK